MLRFNKPILTILGGMGPIAGLELHRKIIFNTTLVIDQDHAQIQHISFPNLISDRSDYLIKKHGNNPGSQAGQLLKSIIQDNPSKYIIGVPCNTFHSPIIFDLFQSIITFNKPNVEIINMIKSTVKYLEYKQYKKIGILCTNGKRQDNLYQDIISKKNMELVMISTSKQHQKVDCIILDCVELPLDFSNKYCQNIEIINPIDILAKEMVKKYNDKI